MTPFCHGKALKSEKFSPRPGEKTVQSVCVMHSILTCEAMLYSLKHCAYVYRCQKINNYIYDIRKRIFCLFRAFERFYHIYLFVFAGYHKAYEQRHAEGKDD